MGASIRQGAFITEGLLKIMKKLTAQRGRLLDKRCLFGSGRYRLSGHLRYMHAQT